MHKKGVFTILAAIVWLGIGIKAAHAQTDTPRYEVSGVVTAIRQDSNFYHLEPDFFFPHPNHYFGFGGRFTFNINRILAVEGELTYHPQERGIFTAGLFSPPF